MMSLWRRCAGVILLLFLTILLGGCLIATKDTIVLPQISSLFEGVYKVDPYMEKNRPRTVAVLPFYDRSQSKEGFEPVRRGFYNHFSSLPFKDMELYRVDDLLKKADLTDPETINKTSPQKLGEILGVDAVIYGDISNFDKIFAVIYSQVSVGAEIKMYETKTGNFLWSGQHVTRIHEGGLSTTPIGIIASVIASAINVRDIQLLRACDDLFREMVKTIPVPPLAAALRPPSINLLVQDTKNLPRKAGDQIRVVMQGTPKMRGSFDIGTFKKRIDMEEQADAPGAYLGIYRVVPGDNVVDALITGRLTDDSGNSAEWVDAIGTVTLDTTPPGPPERVRTIGRDKLVLLNWGKSPAQDLAAYRLYRSATPLSGYQEILKTELTEHRDLGLVNGQLYYYRASAVDRAGNESDPTELIVGMPVAPGPTPVGGVIDVDTTWYAGASPYVIENEVTVRDKALLTIEPGTEIRSRGGALVIEGRIKAQGDSERLILFDAAEGATQWAGVRFANVKEKANNLEFVRIKNATIAIACDASSPRVESSELTENATALAIRGAFSAPVVMGNMIHKNTGAAIIVSDGAKPRLSENRIQDNAMEGVLIRSAAPSILRNTITKNRGGGLSIQGSQADIAENKITDNGPFDLVGEIAGEPVKALNNWWGTVKGQEIFARIRGRVDVRSILDAPYPDGKPLELPILPSQLSGALKADGYLILSNSPYTVKGDVTLTGGAILHVEPGVIIQYDRNTSIIVEDGGVVALGTKEMPIVFTASGAAPAPGSYQSAVRFAKQTKVNSAFSHCVIQYATIGLDVYYGTPEISSSHIAMSSQSGVYCRNDAAPQITYSTFEGNLGEGGIKCVGMSNPAIHYSNFVGNVVSVQGFSTIYIDARNNWWGGSPPDLGLIWGDPDKSINIKPWLEGPEERAFRKQ